MDSKEMFEVLSARENFGRTRYALIDLARRILRDGGVVPRNEIPPNKTLPHGPCC